MGLTNVAVLIPAHNEEVALPGCLMALQAAICQANKAYPNVEVEVTVALDRCTDRSATLVQAAGFHALSGEFGSVGATRASAAAWAISQHTGMLTGLEQLWLACTDADTIVPGHWLTTQIELGNAGADAVVGTVEPDHELSSVERQKWFARHILAEGHPHVHGANLGVRASSYVEAGGFRPMRVHEDVDLVERLRALDEDAVRATDQNRVVTSSRRRARAVGGFATYLEALQGAGEV